MEPLVTADGVSRRAFLKWAGMGAAASVALVNSAVDGWGDDIVIGRFRERQLNGTHDLPSLPVWGPYSKKHFGISHIPDIERGLVFDLSLFPLLAQGPVQLPSVTEKCGVHPWEVSAGIEYYSLRFELIPQDQLFGDLSFSRLAEHSRLVRLELVNQTASPQQLTLNCLAQLVFPPLKELTAEPIRLVSVELPTGTVWVHALDYTDMKFARPRPTDNLVTDGKWRGEERRHDSVEGAVLAENFGVNAGDTVVYRLSPPKALADASLLWRFQMNEGDRVVFQWNRGAQQGEITFQGDGQFATVAVPLGPIPAGESALQFTSRGGAAVALNGFVLGETASMASVRFVTAPWHPVPEIEVATHGLVLKYQDIANYYGFNLGRPLVGHRQLKWRDLDTAFGTKAGPDTRSRIFGDQRRGRSGDPDSLFVHAFSDPFTIAPHSRLLIHAVVGTGKTADNVRRLVNDFQPEAARHEHIYESARASKFQPVATPAGEEFQFSQQLVAAVTLSNLIYPLNVQRRYIRHFSPGRIWDCVYTWDAGFIGLGLLEIDPPRAVEILNAYLTAPGAQSAFIHHGSPVPVQIYLFFELWNRTQSHELLEYFYPRVRQYHRFMAGRLGSSTTRRHRDHLICTWDYFYNSGGWDDYPPQKYVHQQKLERSATPVINSAHTVRCAKILRAAAAALGCTGDFAEYDEDISVLSTSLQKYSWDAATGYFGYVLHDEQGEPTGILRDASGVNFNMGLDGVWPLVAGICEPEQEQAILENIFSTKHLWMDIGITTVDQSAPYFSATGYWNGSVWLAHQWFLWKTMLDLGRAELASRIALTGLQLWKRVTDSTYDCMEHFKPQEPFGFGWHQFSSLSSPALPWFAAHFTPGRLTCGFEVWLQEIHFHRDNQKLRAKLTRTGSDSSRKCSALACMSPGRQYRVTWNGSPASFTVLHDGLLQIQIPGGSASGELLVIPA
jgi:hypothetical protein